MSVQSRLLALVRVDFRFFCHCSCTVETNSLSRFAFFRQFFAAQSRLPPWYFSRLVCIFGSIFLGNRGSIPHADFVSFRSTFLCQRDHSSGWFAFLGPLFLCNRQVDARFCWSFFLFLYKRDFRLPFVYFRLLAQYSSPIETVSCHRLIRVLFRSILANDRDFSWWLTCALGQCSYTIEKVLLQHGPRANTRLLQRRTGRLVRHIAQTIYRSSTNRSHFKICKLRRRHFPDLHDPAHASRVERCST